VTCVPTHRYEAHIEEMIAAGLPSDMAMPDFMEALPAYLEGPGGSKEETSSAVTLLLDVSDFGAFKEMMMFEKQEKDKRLLAAAPSVRTPPPPPSHPTSTRQHAVPPPVGSLRQRSMADALAAAWLSLGGTALLTLLLMTADERSHQRGGLCLHCIACLVDGMS